jgi:para-aminobenzoate synthetase component I
MSTPRLVELPYSADSTGLFDRIADLPWAVFLDSAHPRSRQGRYDILAAEPHLTLTTRGGVTEVRRGTHTERSGDDPFALVRRHLDPPAEPVPGLPFCGGALGYFAYDLGRRIERLPALAADDVGMPEMALGIYDWAVVVDHLERRSWLIGQGRDPGTFERWQALLDRFSADLPARARPRFALRSQVRSNLSRERYADAFGRVQRYIREGDCYQVNLAQRFSARAEGDAWSGYRCLREINPAPFAAYLNTPYGAVLSASPERFLRVRGGEVETRPIKGTRPRSSDPTRDGALAEELLASAKDRAENLMIVDLLRNDIGKTCAVGSVHVPKLFELESFATVHHLVSTVAGRLAAGRDALDLLRGCFPGGSITGAPKLRAMEIIEELEPHRRGVYCGSIGYIGHDGAMDTSIAIRTLIHTGGRVYFSAGGGLVADSRLDEEYQETFDKAAALLRFLEQAGPGGVLACG